MALDGSGSDYETLTDPLPEGPLLLGWVAAVLCTLFVAFCLCIVLFGDARDNQPRIRLEIGPIIRTNALARPWSEGGHSASARRQRTTPAQSSAHPAQASLPGGPSAGLTTTGPTPVGQTVRQVLRPLYAGSALVADPTLVDNTPQGPLPRISDGGRTPLAAYARHAPIAAGKPKIAIVMFGFGASDVATTSALAALPPEVTVGFVPRNDAMQVLVNDARSRGHEVLLQVPMEPADYPDSDPGPHTLRAGQGEEANLQHLAWALTRFTGYVGVAGDQGARFLSNSEALAPVMTFLARRGLMFYDGGSTPKSAAPDLARQTGTAFARGTLEIDRVQNGAAIDRALSDLEAEARAHGAAVGSAFLYPVSVDRVSHWARGLSSRGFVLVPASAIVGHSK